MALQRTWTACRFFFGIRATTGGAEHSLHRVVQTLRWLAGDDSDDFERMDQPDELRERVRGWLIVLVAYATNLSPHMNATSTHRATKY